VIAWQGHSLLQLYWKRGKQYMFVLALRSGVPTSQIYALVSITLETQVRLRTPGNNLSINGKHNVRTNDDDSVIEKDL
jgi:hypothetical protein